MPTLRERHGRDGPGAEVFVDTGGWIALLSRDDAHHAAAAAAWPDLLNSFRRIVTTNLVIAESYTFLRSTVGFPVAWALLERYQATPRLRIVYADADLEAAACVLLRRYRDHLFSYVDAVSFAAMQQSGIVQAFGFDQHFAIAGFALMPAQRRRKA
jgi:predicted nucleic acid-binding protein